MPGSPEKPEQKIDAYGPTKQQLEDMNEVLPKELKITGKQVISFKAIGLTPEDVARFGQPEQSLPSTPKVGEEKLGKELEQKLGPLQRKNHIETNNKNNPDKV